MVTQHAALSIALGALIFIFMPWIVGAICVISLLFATAFLLNKEHREAMIFMAIGGVAGVADGCMEANAATHWATSPQIVISQEV